MVDFKSDATVTTPSWDILKLLALEKRESLILSVEFYFKNQYLGSDSENDLNIIRARLWCLYYELESWIKRTKQQAEIESLQLNIKEGDEKQILSAVSYINQFMDEMNLTRIDTKKVYNKGRVEVENELQQM